MSAAFSYLNLCVFIYFSRDTDKNVFLDAARSSYTLSRIRLSRQHSGKCRGGISSHSVVLLC